MPDMQDLTPARMGNTGFFDITSATNGEIYRIFVYRPEGEAPAEGWPILYMTDGNAVIGTAVDVMRAQASYPSGTNIAHGIVVTIGYPVEGAYDPFRRSWDLSPPPGSTYPPFYENTPEVKTGGGEAFLAMIETEIKPRIEAMLPVDRSRQALFGHSFGGLFVLYALFTRPGAFRIWIAASPSIYWEERVIDGFYTGFAAAPATQPGARLYLSGGEYETEKLAPFQIGAADEAERLAQKAVSLLDRNAIDLAEKLNALPTGPIRASFELHPGENHMSILPVAVNRAIQAAFAIREV